MNASLRATSDVHCPNAAPYSLTAAFAPEDNIQMSNVATSGGSFAALSAEAASLLEKAKEYRAKMDTLAADDPRRAEYEQLIRDLLKTANSISSAVTAGVKAS